MTDRTPHDTPSLGPRQKRIRSRGPPNGGQFPTAHEQASVVDRGGVCFHGWAEADTTTRSGRATTTEVPH